MDDKALPFAAVWGDDRFRRLGTIGHYRTRGEAEDAAEGWMAWQAYKASRVSPCRVPKLKAWVEFSDE